MCHVFLDVVCDVMMREKQEQLEQEVLQYKEQVSTLEDKLDSVTKVKDEELNIMLLTAISHISQYNLTVFIITLSPLSSRNLT